MSNNSNLEEQRDANYSDAVCLTRSQADNFFFEAASDEEGSGNGRSEEDGPWDLEGGEEDGESARSDEEWGWDDEDKDEEIIDLDAL